MVKFTLNSENIKRFSSLANSSKEIAASTEPFYIIQNGLLKTRLYSPSQMMSFDIQLEDVEGLEEDAMVYFNYSIVDLISTINRVSNDGANNIEITLRPEDTRASIRNTETDTVISVSVEITVGETQASLDALNYIQESKETTFKDDTISVNITPELATVFDTANKLMNIAAFDGITTNSALIKGNKLCFATTKQIFEKELSKEYTEKEVYLQKRIFDVLKPFLKSATDGVNVVLNSSQNKVLVESSEFGFASVIGLEQVNFVYPNEEELNSILPDPDNVTILKTNKTELKKAIDLFNGTFKNNWTKSPITFVSSAETLSQNYVNFSHTDAAAECVTKVGITEFTSNGADKDISVEFDFNSASFNNLLNLVSEDDLEIQYSASIDFRELHGAGLLIKAPGVLALCCKNVL